MKVNSGSGTGLEKQSEANLPLKGPCFTRACSRKIPTALMRSSASSRSISDCWRDWASASSTFAEWLKYTCLPLVKLAQPGGSHFKRCSLNHVAFSLGQVRPSSSNFFLCRNWRVESLNAPMESIIYSTSVTIGSYRESGRPAGSDVEERLASCLRLVYQTVW